jgi:transposase InsO family protein
MSATTSTSAHKTYPVATVCRVWDVPRSTFYDWKARQQRVPDASRDKPGPKTAHSDEQLTTLIQTQLAKTEAELQIRGEGHRKVWARLRHAGIRTSKRRVLRLMRKASLLAPTRTGRARGPRNHDGNIHTEHPDEMWGTDGTQVALRSGLLCWVFLAIDHCTAECIGVHASLSGSRFEALEPLRQGVRELLGPIDRDVARGLAIRHDHGSQYMSRAFQEEIAFLGMRSSPSYVGQPEGNGVAERFVRTLKEQLLWVHTFDTVEELRQALQAFRKLYNDSWLVARHGHQTPSQIRAQRRAAKVAA